MAPGYQDQLIIEARDFLLAIEQGRPRWPTFRDGCHVNAVIEATWHSFDSKRWVNINNFT